MRHLIYIFALIGIFIFAVVFSTYSATTVTPIFGGGTGTSTLPTYGKLFVGNNLGGYDLMATSTLGITASISAGTYDLYGQATNTLNTFLTPYYATTTHLNISSLPSLSITSGQMSDIANYWDNRFNGTSTTGLTEGTNLYFTDARAQGAVSATYPIIDTVGVFSLADMATGTITCVGTASCGAGSYVIGSNLTITATGGSGVGTISTSTSPTIGNLAFWTSKDAFPETLGTVATTTLTATAPLVLDNPVAKVGGSNSVLTCSAASGSAAGCLSSGNWTFFNGKLASSSLSAFAPLSYNPNSGVFAISTSTGSTSGFLSAANWQVFNDKVSSTTLSNANDVWFTASTTLRGTNLILSGALTGNVTGALTGNADTATQLATPRNINGVAFDGTAAITINAASSTLFANANTWAGANTFASTLTGTLTGNADTATKLATARAINGVNFDGSAAITIASTTLLANNNTFTGLNAIANASTTALTANAKIIRGDRFVTFGHSTSSWNGTTTQYLAPAVTGEIWTDVVCETDVGTIGVSIYDGTNRMDYIKTASSTINTFTLGTNNTFTANETRRVDMGTPATAPLKLSCKARYYINE